MMVHPIDLAARARRDRDASPRVLPSATWKFTIMTEAAANYDGNMINELGACLGMVMSAGFVALYAVLSKILLSGAVEPFVFLAHRQVLAAAMMLPLAWWRDGLHAPPREQLPRLFALGFLFFSNIGGFIVGLQMTNAFSVIVMQLSIPGMSLGLNWALGKERPSATQVIWTAITTLGCLLAVSGTRSTSMSLGDFSRLELYAAAVDVRFVGGICVLLAQCAAFACFAVLQKHVLVACPPLFSVVAWTHQISALFCILTAVGCGQASALVAADAYSTRGVLTLVYAAGFGTVGSFLLMAYATRWLPASIVSTVFSALEPVWVTLFQWLLLAEKLQPLTLIGNLVATLGIAMLCRAQYYDSKVLTTADERLLLAAEPE